MVLFISPFKAKQKLAETIREKRLSQNLTQEGLSERSGVPLATLRKFEQKGSISLESFLKLVWILGGLEELIQSLQITQSEYASIEDVLTDVPVQKRKRGTKK